MGIYYYLYLRMPEIFHDRYTCTVCINFSKLGQDKHKICFCVKNLENDELFTI